MKKQDAYDAMVSGKMVRNDQFTSFEYLMSDSNSKEIIDNNSEIISNFWSDEYYPTADWTVI